MGAEGPVGGTAPVGPRLLRRPLWPPIAALLLFLTEVATFVQLGERIGYLTTLLAVVAVSLVGLLVLRREWRRAWHRLRSWADSGQPPGAVAVDAVVGLAAALLLVLPGLVTGLVGALMLTPPVRRIVTTWARDAVVRRLSSPGVRIRFAGHRMWSEETRVWPEETVTVPGQVDGRVVEGQVVDPPPR